MCVVCVCLHNRAYLYFTVWEIYTAELPWSDCDLNKMVHKVLALDQRPPIPSDMPKEYAQIVQVCWATDPASRPEFEELLPILRDLCATLNPRSSYSGSGRGIHPALNGAIMPSNGSVRSNTPTVVAARPVVSTGSSFGGRDVVQF